MTFVSGLNASPNCKNISALLWYVGVTIKTSSKTLSFTPSLIKLVTEVVLPLPRFPYAVNKK